MTLRVESYDHIVRYLDRASIAQRNPRLHPWWWIKKTTRKVDR